MSPHPPTLVLERHLRQEPLGEGAIWAAHLKECPECATELSRMRQEDASYLLHARAQQLARSLPRSNRAGPWSKFFRYALGPALLAAAALLLWSKVSNDSTGLVPKGGGLGLIVQRGATQGPWDGRPLRAGDSLQVLWTSPLPGQIAVFASQGREVSQIDPDADPQSHPIAAGSQVPLGGSLRVDGRPLQIDLFFAPNPFELAPVRVLLEKGSARAFRGHHEQVLLPGEARP